MSYISLTSSLLNINAILFTITELVLIQFNFKVKILMFLHYLDY